MFYGENDVTSAYTRWCVDIHVHANDKSHFDIRIMRIHVDTFYLFLLYIEHVAVRGMPVGFDRWKLLTHGQYEHIQGPYCFVHI